MCTLPVPSAVACAWSSAALIVAVRTAFSSPRSGVGVTVGKRTATAFGVGGAGVGVGKTLGDGVLVGFRMAQIQSSCWREPISVTTAASKSVINPNVATRNATRPLDRRDAAGDLFAGVEVAGGAAISTNNGHFT